MKKKWLLFFIIATMCLSACHPAEEADVQIGTEDGGGSGYGVSAASALRLSDFYFITKNSTRQDNCLQLGTPFYSMGDSDSYTLEDGSSVTLTYNSQGILQDTLYSDFASGKNYGLFDKLVQLGVMHDAAPNGNTPSTEPNTNGGAATDGGNSAKPQNGNGNSQSGEDAPAKIEFSNRLHSIEKFASLNLYLDRATVLSTFGNPNYFAARQYKKDLYIIDCYNLTDGGVLMLDYGYDRKSLRCAAKRGADGVSTSYLGQWTVQEKPGDFVRTRIKLNSVTALQKGMTPEAVYQKIGEPGWFEGTNKEYRDVYTLSDDSLIYLSYDASRTALSAAYMQGVDGKVTPVSLR